MRNEKSGYSNQIKSIAIGSFDGIHIAHQTLIDKVDALVIIERDGGYLTPGHKRALCTNKACFFYHFDVIKELSPEAFVKKLQEDFPLLETIVVGYDFHFGKNKAGNAQMLSQIYDKNIIIVDEVSHKNIPIHSRTIKAYLKEGNIKMTNALLGREYHMEGEVVQGQGLGKKELVPTLNLVVKGYQLPLEGVYATRTKIEDSWYPSVSFLGHRVSTDGSFAVETHILDEDVGTVTGHVALAFIDFIRPNQKFESLEVLKAQIEADIDTARALVC